MRFWLDSRQFLHHQYGISVAESQTFLLAKRPSVAMSEDKHKPKLKLTDFCEAPLYMPHPHYKLFVRVAILTVKGLHFVLEKGWLTKESWAQDRTVFQPVYNLYLINEIKNNILDIVWIGIFYPHLLHCGFKKGTQFSVTGQQTQTGPPQLKSLRI